MEMACNPKHLHRRMPRSHGGPLRWADLGGYWIRSQCLVRSLLYDRHTASTGYLVPGEALSLQPQLLVSLIVV